MKVLYLLLFAFCGAVVLFVLYSDRLGVAPEQTGLAFVKAVQAGNTTAIIPFFGDVTCSCPPKGGYGGYLNLGSGLDPNLTFMLGCRCQVGRVTASKVPKQFPYLLPWEKPVCFAVDLPLTFESSVYSPLLLPVPMAFGERMDEMSLQKFVSHPDIDKNKAFSWRLRQSLEPGLVKPQLLKPEDAEIAKTIRCLFPRDAGEVVTSSGNKMARQQVASLLPRLNSVVLQLMMERRGTYTPWLISRFKLHDAIVQTDNHPPVRISDATALTPDR